MSSMERRLKALERDILQRKQDVDRRDEMLERLRRAREWSGLPERPSIWEGDPPPPGLGIAELLDLARQGRRAK